MVTVMIMNNIVDSIRQSQRIAILPHVQADGDAIGSSLALAIALKKMDKSAKIFIEEDIPRSYSFLPAKEMTYKGNDIKEQAFDLIIALDTGDEGRLGERIKVFSSSKDTINIDHHKTNTLFAALNHIDINASATGEIVFKLIKLLGIEIDTDIASCLYVAIATDTGGFRYSNTTSDTHKIVADLVDADINVADISKRLFDTSTKQRVKLMAHALGSLELIMDDKVSFITITNQMLDLSGATDEDCDGFVNIGRSIDGVEVSVAFREKSSCEYKVNLRSRATVDVSKVAVSLGGGGHKLAAGCTVKATLDEVKSMIIEELKKVL